MRLGWTDLIVDQNFLGSLLAEARDSKKDFFADRIM